MNLTKKEIKERYFAKKKAAAKTIKCSCGCGTDILDTDDYGRPREYENGHNGRKYPDKWGYQKAWIKRNRAWVNKRWSALSHKRKIELMEYKGNSCKHCGQEYNGKNGAAFDFHHRVPKDKLYSMGGKLTEKPLDELKKEVDKCDLLCRNCHSVHHIGEF